MKGIKRNRIGTVTSIETEGLTVTFSANDEARLAEVIMTCPLDALKAQDPPQAEKKAKTAKAAEEQPLADGVEWKAYDEAAVELAVKHHMTCFLEQLRIQHSPTHTMVVIHEETYFMVAKEDLQPLALRRGRKCGRYGGLQGGRCNGTLHKSRRAGGQRVPNGRSCFDP